MIIKKIIPGNDSKNTSSFSCKAYFVAVLWLSYLH